MLKVFLEKCRPLKPLMSENFLLSRKCEVVHDAVLLPKKILNDQNFKVYEFLDKILS